MHHQLAQIFTYVAVAVLELDFERLDINQCPIGSGNPRPNYFAGTSRCKNDTTECEPVHGYGFRRGGYQCRCRPGFRRPRIVRNPYHGELIERATEHDYRTGFHCEKIGSGSAQDSCDVDVDGAEELMPVALRDTLRGVRFADYVEVDTGASVCGALTDEDIIAQVAGAQPVAEEPEGEEDEDDEAPVRPSASAGMEALNVARLFFSFEEGEEDSLRRVRALEQRAAAVAFREKKQMVITDFFGQ
ncbi:hypothetical protein HPB52_004901 [Rhipicephalus sanguineus]|uniref:GPR158/179 extracellular domain-containing protein n=1 Tax=Rhipicephalus sanguineus TaxID=34632 RepID=A0A9D4PNR1_RHISA|nr:hypothetical protein HPB52_004901 [Rhipicephalus sanguineus]